MNAAQWRVRLDAANRRCTTRLFKAAVREFETLAAAIDPKQPSFAAQRRALDAHQARLSVLLAAHARACAVTFAFLALEMGAVRKTRVFSDKGAGGIETKEEPPPTRAERVGAVVADMARTVATGAAARATAERLAQNRVLLSYIEMALIASPDDPPSAIAARLLADRRVAAALSVAHAEATGVSADLADIADALGERSRARRGGQPRGGGSGGASGGSPPRTPPIPPGGGGAGPPPRRSRFSQLVERLVREEAPLRARRIAATSGRAIAAILGEAAANGWGEERTAKELERALGPEVTRQRARTIARTELGDAASAATEAIALDRADAGEELDKVWVSIEDDRRRKSHEQAHGQRVPVREKFRVGESLMSRPHDPTAPLKERINCRCALLIYRRSTPRG